jgi:hypothetical protein
MSPIDGISPTNGISPIVIMASIAVSAAGVFQQRLSSWQ